MPRHPPKVFVSAASGDLRGARQAVKEALLDIGCHPVEQTNFPPDYRSVTAMLREKIEDCQALIHIVGKRYGAEPDAEPADKRTLQAQHRRAILEGAVVARGDDAIAGRAGPARAVDSVGDWGAVVGLAGIGYEVYQMTGEMQQQTVAVNDIRAKLEEIIKTERQSSAKDDNLTPQQRYDRALAEVAFKHEMTPDNLRAAIDDWTATVKADPKASVYDQALVEYKAQHFDAAAQKAAYGQAMQSRQRHTAEAIKAARLEGDAHRAAVRFEQALAAYQKAAALTDRHTEAEPLMRRALAILLKFTRATSHEHPELRKFYRNYGVLLGEMKFTKVQIVERINTLGPEAGFDGEGYRRLLAELAAE
jgi:tetratricopeptide (TPR) repeat protein